MKDVHIRLPDRIHDLLTRAAAAAGARPDDHATDLLVEALLASEPPLPTSPPGSTSTPATPRTPQQELAGLTPPRPTPVFRCAGRFPGASHHSIDWAQRFVDAALRYDGVSAFASNEGGVGFEPNYVFIERVYTQEDGFAASFYGSQSDFQHHGVTVEPGRNASYSRYKVKSPRDLDVALRCIQISATAKRLRTNA